MVLSLARFFMVKNNTTIYLIATFYKKIHRLFPDLLYLLDYDENDIL